MSLLFISLLNPCMEVLIRLIMKNLFLRVSQASLICRSKHRIHWYFLLKPNNLSVYPETISGVIYISLGVIKIVRSLFLIEPMIAAKGYFLQDDNRREPAVHERLYVPLDVLSYPLYTYGYGRDYLLLFITFYPTFLH